MSVAACGKTPLKAMLSEHLVSFQVPEGGQLEFRILAAQLQISR